MRLSHTEQLKKFTSILIMHHALGKTIWLIKHCPVLMLSNKRVHYKKKSNIPPICLICSYTQNARKISDRYRDQLRPPLETAIHWVKHVAKNKGASQMRMVAVDLPFIVLYNLDVWAFILCAITMGSYIIQLVLRLSLWGLCNREVKWKQN